MLNECRKSIVAKIAGFAGTLFLYVLMLGIVIRAARRPSTGY